MERKKKTDLALSRFKTGGWGGRRTDGLAEPWILSVPRSPACVIVLEGLRPLKTGKRSKIMSERRKRTSVGRGREREGDGWVKVMEWRGRERER